MMRKQLLLIIAVSVLGSSAARAGEPAAIKKVSSQKASTSKYRSDAPRLFSETVKLAQAQTFAPPPAPAVDGPVGEPVSTTEPVPMDVPMTSDASQMGAVQLYDCVKYEDLDNVHPCAVTKIVAVVDPCQSPCDCCGPQCVYVQICVPPCGCPEIKTSHGGRKVKYDYGKYEVEITSKKGVVEVDYDKGLFNHF